MLALKIVNLRKMRGKLLSLSALISSVLIAVVSGMFGHVLYIVCLHLVERPLVQISSIVCRDFGL